MPTPAFTPSQLAAITHTGGGLLLSAAAGSGKTATLAHRVAHLVSHQQLPLERILVLTFTDNAAAEMRSRIESVLRGMADISPHLRRQSLLVPRAPISTIHSFCTRLIRRHFGRLGVDPRFTVLTEEPATLLRDSVIREVLDAAHRGAANEDFPRLVEYFGGGDDDRVGKLVLKLDHALSSELDPDKWCVNALARLQAAATDPHSCDLAAELATETAHRLAHLRAQLEHARTLCQSVYPKLADHIAASVEPYLDRWESEFAQPGGVWSLKLPAIGFDKAPPVKKDVAGGDTAKEVLKQLKEQIKLGPLPGGLPPDPVFFASASASSVPFVRELLRLYAHFQIAHRAAKDARRQLDFSDLERFALRLLRDPATAAPSEIALQLQSQYAHVLIDESQDINAVQNTLLSLISTDSSSRPSNLFSVGDVKQSIYRFRLAEPELFLDRQRTYTAAGRGTVILLKENFRSRGPLLAAVNAIFSRLLLGGRTEIDYSHGHTLFPGATYPQPNPLSFTGAPLELHILPPADHAAPATDVEDPADTDTDTDTTDSAPPSAAASDEDLENIEREAALIAHRIRQLMGLAPSHGGESKHALVFDKASADAPLRPLRYSDIAILLRSAQVKARQLSAVLRRHGIPVHADARGGLLAAQEVRDVLAVLELLENPDRDLALLTFLRSPLAGIAPNTADEDIARARAAHPTLPFSQAVITFAVGTHPSALVLQPALARLSAWRVLAARLCVAETLDHILVQTHFTAHLAGLPDGHQKQANLAELLSHARSFSPADSAESTSFSAFIRALEDLSDLAQPSVSPGEDDVVRILTIHKSKGLEYPVVFLPDLAKRLNEQDLKGDLLIGKDTFLAAKAVDDSRRALYPSPAWLIARASCRSQVVAEELRVLYVALTRAREHLILVATPSAKLLEQLRLQYDPAEPLTESDVLSASTPLHWLLMSVGENSPHLQLTHHTAGDIARLAASHQAPTATEVPEPLLSLRPLSSPPASPLATSILSRISRPYPHPAAASRPAVISVTTLTHSQTTTTPHPTPPPHLTSDIPHPTSPPPSLPLPRFLAEDALALSATDRGTATHVAIEHFDFIKNPHPTPADLELHLKSLVDRRILTPREAGAVETSAFTFLASSPLAPYLSGQRGPLHKELPIYLPRALPESGLPPHAPPSPLDRQMIRGRIDLLVDTPQGPVIIDYKTDNVWGERLTDRIALYQPQVALYRAAAEALLGRTCPAIFLAFVHPRARHIAEL